MGDNTSIPWCDMTFSPWWGCAQVSPECAHCYAEKLAVRFGTKWGPHAHRRFFGDKHWNEPRQWQRRAEKRGTFYRVFCASMCDVFEDRRDLDSQRERLWELIESTPRLLWLLLTKRPENLESMIPGGTPPNNVWLGVTAGTQRMADQRIPRLLKIPAVVHFVSCEPILEELRIENSMRGEPRVNWVICGDESGYHRRPAELNWARALRDQCAATNTPYFFKQWHRPSFMRGDRDIGNVIKVECPDLDGQIHREFPR